MTSNPVALELDMFAGVFVQARDGQVYAYTESKMAWDRVGTTVLPQNTSAAADANSLVISLEEVVHVFVKTIEQRPRLYWTQGSTSAGFGEWALVGGNDEHLSSPPAVAVNFFTNVS